MRSKLLVVLVLASVTAVANARELTWSYVVPAVANTTGALGTDWHTDLTVYNPHTYTLPIVLQFLETGRDNSHGVPTIEIDIYPWETLNFWDVLGENGFKVPDSSGAVLVYGDDLKRSCANHACDISVFARTYTLDPKGGAGEFGQAVPGFPTNLGLDSSVLAFMPQIMDDQDFRTNVGVVSMTDGMVTVRFELQDKDGNVIRREDRLLPPFGHSQWRLEADVSGGTLAAFIQNGPSGAVVVPYASVINNATGDAVHIEADMTAVGVSMQSAAVRRPSGFPAREPVTGFRVDRQASRQR